MRLTDPALQSALAAWRATTDPARRAEADNIWFEARVSDPRRASFESRAAGAADADALRRRHWDYYEESVKTDVDPPTFLTAFAPADLGTLDPTQYVLRLEDLRRPLAAWGEPFDKLQSAHAANDAAVLGKFVEIWNGLRDARPAFAAFARQFTEELCEADWPRRLRDRLGLAHYNGAVEPIPVALMQYHAEEVQQAAAARALGCAFAAPTVLDGPPNPWFFPSPQEADYGRTMALFEVHDDSQLVAEVLHPRIDYRARHIMRLSVIDQGLPVYDIKTLRNYHLLALHDASRRDDFGELIP
jgi:hypothetical protein